MTCVLIGYIRARIRRGRHRVSRVTYVRALLHLLSKKMALIKHPGDGRRKERPMGRPP